MVSQSKWRIPFLTEIRIINLNLISKKSNNRLCFTQNANQICVYTKVKFDYNQKTLIFCACGYEKATLRLRQLKNLLSNTEQKEITEFLDNVNS